MKEYTCPFVVVFITVVAAIVAMFGLTDHQPTQDHLLGYMDTIVPFLVGATAGGAVGGSVGYLRGQKSVGR